MTTIILPFLPPKELSPNGRYHWGAKSRVSSKVRRDTELIAKSYEVDFPLYDTAHLDILCVCAEERRRDPDNWGARCKPIIDGLRDAKVIKADDYKHLSIKVRFEVDKDRAPLTEITVTEGLR